MPVVKPRLPRWWWVAALLGLVLIGALFALGRSGVADFEGWGAQLTALSDSPWGVPSVFVLFTAGAFLGAPQFLLFSLAIAAFGPWGGAALSWSATLLSATLTYGAGRLLGERFARRLGGRAARLAAMIRRNSFKASFIVRNVPAGPFIGVNMAFGALRAGYWGFLAGLAVGMLPKLLVVALAGQGVMAALDGRPWLVAAAVLAALAVFVLSRWVRTRLKRANPLLRNEDKAEDTPAL